MEELLDGPLVLVDIETDGMSPTHRHVLEIAAIRVEGGKIVDEFSSLVNPGGEVPPFITNLTGITTADIADAPAFRDIAEHLLEIMDGAVFVAHNVRFDYSFLKQEFGRLGADFAPRLLCTVKLSRRLFPEYKSHKLASLIERYGFSYSARHRAYDDTFVLWQFLKHVERTVEPDAVREAVKAQLRHPSLPRQLDRALVDSLPTGPGVYIFHDEQGFPLYIGKSVNIRKRVLSHFTRDIAESREFKIAQMIHDITYESTGGELEALLRESQLIKEKQPLYNRKLRRTNKLVALVAHEDEHGYERLAMETLSSVEPAQFETVLALYDRRSKAKESLLATIQTFDLCPKLCGLEKGKGACFSYQLGRCRGACAGREPAESYNRRLALAFMHKRIKSWPYDGPVVVSETLDDEADERRGFIVDQWCIVGKIRQEQDFEPEVTHYEGLFDLDAYKLLKSFMTSAPLRVKIAPYGHGPLY